MIINSEEKRTNVAVRLLAIAVAATQFGVASAHEADPKFTLNHISDAAYGRKISSGEFDDAIQSITAAKRHGTDAIYASMNLCVAYVVTRDLENAANACDAAIVGTEERLAEVLEHRSRHSSKAKAYRKFLAIAYSNRGVLRALGGTDDLARADFEKALALKAKLRAPKVNLARLAVRQAATTV